MDSAPTLTADLLTQSSGGDRSQDASTERRAVRSVGVPKRDLRYPRTERPGRRNPSKSAAFAARGQPHMVPRMATHPLRKPVGRSPNARRHHPRIPPRERICEQESLVRTRRQFIVLGTACHRHPLLANLPERAASPGSEQPLGLGFQPLSQEYQPLSQEYQPSPGYQSSLGYRQPPDPRPPASLPPASLPLAPLFPPSPRYQSSLGYRPSLGYQSSLGYQP